MRTRSPLSLLSLCIAWHAVPAAAQTTEEVQIEDVVTNEEAPAEGDRPRVGSYVGLWFDDLHLDGLDWRFDDPEVAALGGREVDPNGNGSGRGRALAWGVAFGSSIEPTEWLRLPEIRIYLGGASIDGPWHRPEGDDNGLEARATGLFAVKAELAGGLQYRLGPVTPFVLGRVAYAGYFTTVEVRQDTLGALGDEVVCDGLFEAGVEVGLAVSIADVAQVHAAWRRTLVGPATNGLMVGVTIGAPMQQ